MPHRAGYFVLAYAWDHHCRMLYDSLERRFADVEAALSELDSGGPAEAGAFPDYYTKWHRASELYSLTMAEVRSRQYVINSLGYRGYGVNRDLLAALGDLERRYGPLAERTKRHRRQPGRQASPEAWPVARGPTQPSMDSRKKRTGPAATRPTQGMRRPSTSAATWT